MEKVLDQEARVPVRRKADESVVLVSRKKIAHPPMAERVGSRFCVDLLINHRMREYVAGGEPP